MWNYPPGMSRYDLWYVGEGVDRYGHGIGEGYYFDDPTYYPELDDWADPPEEDEEEDDK